MKATRSEKSWLIFSRKRLVCASPLFPKMERQRSESDERTDGNKHIRNKTDAIRARDQKENAWGSLVDWSGEEKRKDLVGSLKDFQKATGINEDKHIQDLEDAKSNREIYEKEKKMQKASITWYEKQLQKSGAFDPIDDREAKAVGRDLKDTVDWFSKLKFSGDVSMISTLCRLQKDLEPHKKFRDKLRDQSKFVQNEYFRRLGSLHFTASKESMLGDILGELKEVENSPSAVQFEFKKKQKTAKASRDTAEVKKEILKEYDKKKHKYVAQVLANKEYFGGEMKKTEYGKVPKAALEYIEWFDNTRKSFAEMDSALKDLPKEIKKRKKLYEERDEILQHALPKERYRIEKQTDKMRRHELESFMPKLREQVRRNSIHVAEYMATITAARTYHVGLFPSFERALNIRKFKVANVETQKARLKVLQDEIQDRDRVVREYFDLPTYLRNDQRFVLASALDKEQILLEAKEEQNREQDSPFEPPRGKTMDAEDIQKVADAIDGSEGSRLFEDIEEELKQEGLMKAAAIQQETYWKVFGAAKSAKYHKETQKEHYLRDLKHWTRLDENVKDESDVRTERQRSKFKFIETADEAYDLGYAFTSGGIVHELQELDERNLKDGTGKIDEKLKRAKYGEHVVINRNDGRMAEDPIKMIERMSEQEMMKLVLLAINKLGRTHMGLGSAETTMLRNSPNIQKELSEKMIDDSFSQLKKAA
jgi:hypothetical protein